VDCGLLHRKRSVLPRSKIKNPKSEWLRIGSDPRSEIRNPKSGGKS